MSLWATPYTRSTYCLGRNLEGLEKEGKAYGPIRSRCRRRSLAKRVWIGMEKSSAIEVDKRGPASSCPLVVIVIIRRLR